MWTLALFIFVQYILLSTLIDLGPDIDKISNKKIGIILFILALHGGGIATLISLDEVDAIAFTEIVLISLILWTCQLRPGQRLQQIVERSSKLRFSKSYRIMTIFIVYFVSSVAVVITGLIT